jgi:glutamate decarboxylase
MPKPLSSDEAVKLYGNRFLTEDAPAKDFPESGMAALDAMRLVDEELAVEGDPQRNLATFVTTWMEPEAQRIVGENLYRNFIDHAEYPISAEIEQRCIRMLADLYHAPGDEPKIVPLREGKYVIGPEDVEPLVDENTIGVAAVLGTTFTGHSDDIRGINRLLVELKNEQGLDVPLHVDAASGGFVWPFLYPDSEWDFRLEQVRSINVSGHKFGLVYPGIGWLVFREKTDLAEDLVFYENYLGKTDATFTLNFSTGASMVLAQYYNFVRYGREGYSYIMKAMESNARFLAEKLKATGDFELIGDGEEQLPLVAFKLAGEKGYDEFDVSWQLSAERGWMLPAYTLPPNAENERVLRALVKQTLSREQIDHLADDIIQACATLEKKGGAHASERKKMKRSPGY